MQCRWARGLQPPEGILRPPRSPQAQRSDPPLAADGRANRRLPGPAGDWVSALRVALQEDHVLRALAESPLIESGPHLGTVFWPDVGALDPRFSRRVPPLSAPARASPPASLTMIHER